MKSRTRQIRSGTRVKRMRGKAVLHPTCGGGPAMPQWRILVPIDFSDGTRMVLRYAVSLARSLKASLLLLYVAETKPAGSELGPCHLPELESDLRQIARHRLAELTQQEVPSELL